MLHLGYNCSMTDQAFMQRALDLAKQGLGSVSPNPMVGCVIMHNNQIIGEGWHKKFGKAHAEVNAVNAVENKALLKEAIFYITLEPCSFHGKTPACSDLLISINPPKVFVASKDPNPRVSGRGIELLKDAGIAVDIGLLEAEAMALNKRFFVTMRLKRPYIILKWAQTSDGFLARTNYNSKWISNEHSRQLVHKWRTEEDAILVGYNTVKYDDPQLTARDWQGRDPVKVIIDPDLGLDNSYQVFNGNDNQVYVFNTKEEKHFANKINCMVNKSIFIADMLTRLEQDNIGSILVEGGAKTLNNFIQLGLWDEARIFTAETTFKEGIAAPLLDFAVDQKQNIMGDRLSIIYNPQTEKIWRRK